MQKTTNLNLACHSRLDHAIFAPVNCHFRLYFAIFGVVAALHFCLDIVIGAPHIRFDLLI